ncbi:radical SAM protein [Candidatus Falkowbacteria bacterium]|nr:radical SAM protein [Candidatus Falkowbacteria bacterium]
MKNKIKTRTPIDATIAITYRCNSRCAMCNIWQEQNPSEMPVEYFRNLAPSLKYVNLTGGEPFLHSDITAVVAAVKKAAPKAQIIISSNGLATELIKERMQKVLAIDPTVGVRISIDGLGGVHDKVRGIPGIYENAIATISMLKEIGVKNLGLSFTIMDDNADSLYPVYALSRKLGIEMALALVQNSDIYFQKETNRVTKQEVVERDLLRLIKGELASVSPKKWLRAFYDYGLLHYARQSERLLPSGAGVDSLFIDPSGQIFPSNLINLPMGNLGEAPLQQIWLASQARAVRQKMEKEGISESWIICTIRGEMRRHPFRVLSWVAYHKLIKKVS